MIIEALGFLNIIQLILGTITVSWEKRQGVVSPFWKQLPYGHQCVAQFFLFLLVMSVHLYSLWDELETTRRCWTALWHAAHRAELHSSWVTSHKFSAFSKVPAVSVVPQFAKFLHCHPCRVLLSGVAQIHESWLRLSTGSLHIYIYGFSKKAMLLILPK